MTALRIRSRALAALSRLGSGNGAATPAVELVRVGPGLDPDLLTGLREQLPAIFGLNCRVQSETLDAAWAFSANRNQFHSTAILARLAEAEHLPETRILGITELDLFVPVLTYVFGEGQVEGHCALVSMHRLRESFYGLPERRDLLEERLLKEAVHELGHTYGLRHCPDWRCVMASTHAVERLDLKAAEFCPACRAVVRRR